MANSTPTPEVYNGYRLLGGLGAGNVGPREILIDTSGQWQLVGIAAGVHTYQQRSQ